MRIILSALFLFITVLHGASAGSGAPQIQTGTIDYSCQTDSDCEIKDIGSCCGYHPACTNKNAEINPDLIRKSCENNAVSGICGFPVIESCQCVNNLCRDASFEQTR